MQLNEAVIPHQALSLAAPGAAAMRDGAPRAAAERASGEYRFPAALDVHMAKAKSQGIAGRGRRRAGLSLL